MNSTQQAVIRKRLRFPGSRHADMANDRLPHGDWGRGRV